MSKEFQVKKGGKHVSDAFHDYMRLSGQHISCPNCGNEARWSIMNDETADAQSTKRLLSLAIVCTRCNKFVIPVIPKQLVEPANLLMMDLQERVRKLEGEEG